MCRRDVSESARLAVGLLLLGKTGKNRRQSGGGRSFRHTAKCAENKDVQDPPEIAAVRRTMPGEIEIDRRP